MRRLDPRTSEHHFVFELSGTLFGISATAAREVAPCPPMIRVPRTGRVLAGLCHFRNELLPVLDLALLAGVDSEAEHARGQLLVLSGSAGDWGVLIDRAVGLGELDTSCSADMEQVDGWANILIGTGRRGDSIVRVLDSEALYREAQKSLAREWEAASWHQPESDSGDLNPNDSTSKTVTAGIQS